MTPETINIHFGMVFGCLKTVAAPIEVVRSLEILQGEIADIRRLYILEKEKSSNTPSKSAPKNGWHGGRTPEQRKLQSQKMKEHWAKVREAKEKPKSKKKSK
jgi:hypothetical protein